MKKIHVYIFVVALLSVVGSVYAGTGKVQSIALEELHLTLIKNGSVISDLKVSEKEGNVLIEKVKTDVLKSLGLKSYKELMEKGLIAKFDRAVDGRLKVERIRPPFLRFYDTDGKIIKEILMKRPGNSRQSSMSQSGSISVPLSINSSISRDAVVSKNGKSAIVTEYFAELAGVDSGKYVSNTFSNIRLYELSGKMLWEESAPKQMYVNKMAISGAGEVIAFILVLEGGEREKVFSANRLLVFDSVKKTLLDFTGKDASYSVISSLLEVSPNGRYISIAAEKKSRDRITLFFDLKSGVSFEGPEVLAPLRLGDNGTISNIDRSGSTVKIHDFAKKWESSN